jgi:hypothetical protein
MKMQLTKSYWCVVAALGVVGAFVASACTVTTSTDDNTAGEPGDTNTTAGSSSAGSSAGGASAGSTSTAGGGDQATDYQCDTGDGGAPPGTASECSPDPANPTDVCAVCVQAHCCAEFGQCYATSPGNQCGYGGPSDGGEYACVQSCLQAGFKSGGVDDADLRAMCFDQCTTNTAHHSSHDCGTLIGDQTNALLGCVSDNCRDQCIGG